MSVSLIDFSELAKPAKYSLEEAEKNARTLISQGQRVSERFVFSLQSATPPPPEEADRMLELLKRLNEPARLIQVLDKAVPAAHPERRESLRAAYVEATRDLSWVPGHLKSASGRNAANLVEALWRAEPSQELLALFAEAAEHPENNRLAGNGLVGLFRLRDERAAAWTAKMLNHEKPEFRASAAWVAGRVGWAGAIPRLQKMLMEPFPRVQNSAAKALQRLRRLQARVA